MNACAACGTEIVGKAPFGIHRDGFCDGPEVDICAACGGENSITTGDLWAAIKVRRNAALHARDTVAVHAGEKTLRTKARPFVVALQAFAQAMREEGADVPDVTVDVGTFAIMAEAFQAYGASTGGRKLAAIRYLHIELPCGTMRVGRQ